MTSAFLFASLKFCAILLALPTIIECPKLRDFLKGAQYQQVPGEATGEPTGEASGGPPAIIETERHGKLYDWEHALTMRKNIPTCEAITNAHKEDGNLGPDMSIGGFTMDRDGEWCPWIKVRQIYEVNPPDLEEMREEAIKLNLGPCMIYKELDHGHGEVKLHFPQVWSLQGFSGEVKQDPSNAFICVGAIFDSEAGFRDLTIRIVAYAFMNKLVGYKNTKVFEDIFQAPKPIKDENGQEKYYIFEKIQLDKVVDPTDANYFFNGLFVEVSMYRASHEKEIILALGPCENDKFLFVSPLYGRMYAVIIVM